MQQTLYSSDFIAQWFYPEGPDFLLHIRFLVLFPRLVTKILRIISWSLKLFNFSDDMKKMYDSIESGPWCLDQYITFQEFLPYTGLFSHYPMKFDGWKDTMWNHLPVNIIYRLLFLKQVYCLRNARFTATWNHFASEPLLSTWPCLKWLWIKP